MNEPKPKTKTPRQRRAARTRQTILDAARDIITEQGAYNLSLREVARRIDYSPAGLYEYFASKDDLIAAVVNEGFERFGHYLKSVSNTLPAVEYLQELGLAYIRFAQQNSEHFMLIFNTVDLCPAELKGDSVATETFIILVKGVERALAEGAIAPHHQQPDVVFGLWSLVHGMATLQITQVNKIDHDWEAAARRMLAAFHKGLQ